MVVEEAVDIAAPVNQVWRALVDPEIRAGWWDYLTLDAQVGGRFEEYWTDPDGRAVRTAGEVTELVEPWLLRLDWADDGWPARTEVEVRLRATGAGTSVRLRHTGWDRLPDGPALAVAHGDGWRLHLTNLRRCVEGAEGEP